MRGAKIRTTNISRRLRRNATLAEQRLWNRVRSRALLGMKFVRQEPVGPYVTDLVCREHRLIIEIDGGQHADNPGDVIRDRWLRHNDYRVLRFWNNDVMRNIEGVLEAIAGALSARTEITESAQGGIVADSAIERRDPDAPISVRALNVENDSDPCFHEAEQTLRSHLESSPGPEA